MYTGVLCTNSPKAIPLFPVVELIFPAAKIALLACEANKDKQNNISGPLLQNNSCGSWVSP